MKVDEVRKYMEKADAQNFMIRGMLHPIYFKVDTMNRINIEMGTGEYKKTDNCDDKEMIKLRDWLCELYGKPEEK